MSRNESQGRPSLGTPADATRPPSKDTRPTPTSPKDLRVVSFSDSASNEDLEFISRAQYDFDKLMEHSNGEWRQDADIIKESLGFYQQKTKADRVAATMAEHETTLKTDLKQPPPKFVIDEFEEDNYKTHSKLTNTFSPRQAAGALPPSSHRNSMRVSELTFGRKALKVSAGKLETVKTAAREPRPAAKENAAPPVNGRKLSCALFGNFYAKYTGRQPVLVPPRRPEVEVLQKVARGLGMPGHPTVTQVVAEAKRLRKRVTELESLVAARHAKGDLFSIRVDAHDDPLGHGSELIDLYNRNRSRDDRSSQANSKYSDAHKGLPSRNSLSAHDWRKRPFSEKSFSVRRGSNTEASSLLRPIHVPVFGLSEKRPKIFGKLSKLVNISRLERGVGSR